MSRSLDKLVEAIEIDVGVLDGEPVGIRQRDNECAQRAWLGSQTMAKDRDVALKRFANVAWQPFAPKQIRQPILWHRPAAGRKQDLENLLWLHPAEVAWAQDAGAVLHRDRAEDPHLEFAWPLAFHALPPTELAKRVTDQAQRVRSGAAIEPHVCRSKIMRTSAE
jgi:hypothetical protein